MYPRAERRHVACWSRPRRSERSALERASPQTHKLFPADARARAVDLLLVGRALAREPHSNPLFEGVMTELWVDIVMPAVLTRTSSVANP